ncbi:MAG: fused DSP-PTPase phosphatase/NAD kinase-like protein, partial [Blastocatellia bacterium]
MKQAFIVSKVFVSILVLLAAGAVAKPRFGHSAIPNFHQVNDNLYRGAQPQGGGIEQLKALGIKSILDMRGASPETRLEKESAEQLGLRFFAVPLSPLHAPSDEQIRRVLAVVMDQANWPVFIHCERGKDRTGTVVACYRIVHDGWTADRAISEARHFGMSKMEFAMRRYVHHYYRANQVARA